MLNSGVNGYLSSFQGTEVDGAVARVQTIDTELAAKVDKTTTINGKSLESNVVLNAADVGALTSDTVYGKSITWEGNLLSLLDAQGRTLSNAYIETDGAQWGHIFGTLSNQTDLQNEFNSINVKIPSAASSTNQLADKNFVNSSIATSTANFIGTFATVSALRAYSGTVTNNDYAFVMNSVVTNNGNDWATLTALNAYDKNLLTEFDYAWVINGTKFDLYRFDIIQQTWNLRASSINKEDVTLNSAYNRYKASVSGSTVTWDYEYTLNNSSFTADQWAAINSGATAVNIGQITTNANSIVTINGKIPSNASPSNKMVTQQDIANMVTTNTAQTISGSKTLTGVTKFQNGSAEGCIILGADVSATTVSAGARKLGRMIFHTTDLNTNCAFVSTDSDSSDSKNYVEFGGRIGDSANTSPDVLRFTVANTHNSKTDKVTALSVSKDSATFNVQPKYNNNNIVTEADIANMVTAVTTQNVSVAGTTKDVAKTNPETLYVADGLIMGGTAAAAGLVTRGICGIQSPDSTGACSKEHLFINYDGVNTFNASRQMILQAGTSGVHYGNNLYQYAVPRGDIIKGYCDAHYAAVTIRDWNVI